MDTLDTLDTQDIPDELLEWVLGVDDLDVLAEQAAYELSSMTGRVWRNWSGML